MMAITHVLVPTDFSAPSERAVEMGVELARRFDARLTLVHVWSLPVVGYGDALTWPANAELERAASEALEEVRARVAAHVPGVGVYLRQGTDYDGILSAAKELGADVIVMGTHGRRGLQRLLLGSVAEKVVRLSRVPVLTVSGARRSEQKQEAA